ncbi:hypothetical protein FACS189421_11600 [Bacteroidia bacterium]|nr:hypothetical protein FACS189421_11600 [Bacteroidia bacterium]
MGDYQSQIMLNIGTGVDHGYLLGPPTRFIPFGLVHFQYSQPNTFFRLPGRMSVNAITTIGMGNRYGVDWRKYTDPIFVLSQDFSVLEYKRFYTGLGAGIGMQSYENERIGSKLLFQFKWFLGYKIDGRWRAELFAHHLSNGHTSANNHSYNFWGLGLGYNF